MHDRDAARRHAVTQPEYTSWTSTNFNTQPVARTKDSDAAAPESEFCSESDGEALSLIASASTPSLLISQSYSVHPFIAVFPSRRNLGRLSTGGRRNEWQKNYVGMYACDMFCRSSLLMWTVAFLQCNFSSAAWSGCFAKCLIMTHLATSHAILNSAELKSRVLTR